MTAEGPQRVPKFDPQSIYWIRTTPYPGGEVEPVRSRCILAILPILIAGAATAQLSDKLDPPFWPWKTTLKSMNPTPVLYEPAWIRMDSELDVDAPPGFNTVPSNDMLCIARPGREFEFPGLRGMKRFGGGMIGGITEGRTGIADFLLVRYRDDYLFRETGRYRLVLNCADRWVGDSVPRSPDPLSNEITFDVRQPDGEDKAALEWAGGPGPLGDLMGLTTLVPGTKVKWLNHRKRYHPPERYWMEFTEAQIAFVSTFTKSAYTPYVLLQLVRRASRGRTVATVLHRDDPDWRGVSEWSEHFLSRYRDHPLAAEAAFYHAQATFRLGKTEAAIRELSDFDGRYPNTAILRFAKNALEGLKYPEKAQRLPTSPRFWEFESLWTVDSERRPLIF